MPKYFVLYTNHKALQYLGSWNELNQRHMKWVEFLQQNSFSLKHKSGQSNKVIDALSRGRNLLTEIKVEILGFDDLKCLYKMNLDFAKP